MPAAQAFSTTTSTPARQVMAIFDQQVASRRATAQAYRNL